MWWDVVADVLLPTGDVKAVERIADRSDVGAIRVELRAPEAFKRRLNESGWLADEVIAAGLLRQGKEPSVLALVTGAALVEVVRPRRSKCLPREFALAVTADRVVAFGMSRWTEGDGTTDRVVKIERGERASWPRGSVTLKDGMLELARAVPIPVTSDGDPSTDELIGLLA